MCLFKKGKRRQQRSEIHDDSNRFASWSLIFTEIFLLRKRSQSGESVRHKEGEWERSGWKDQGAKSTGRIPADFAKPNGHSWSIFKTFYGLKYIATKDLLQ